MAVPHRYGSSTSRIHSHDLSRNDRGNPGPDVGANAERSMAHSNPWHVSDCVPGTDFKPAELDPKLPSTSWSLIQ
jgi:hypothetical protein